MQTITGDDGDDDGDDSATANNGDDATTNDGALHATTNDGAPAIPSIRSDPPRIRCSLLLSVMQFG